MLDFKWINIHCSKHLREHIWDLLYFAELLENPIHNGTNALSINWCINKQSLNPFERVRSLLRRPELMYPYLRFENGIAVHMSFLLFMQNHEFSVIIWMILSLNLDDTESFSCFKVC